MYRGVLIYNRIWRVSLRTDSVNLSCVSDIWFSRLRVQVSSCSRSACLRLTRGWGWGREGQAGRRERPAVHADPDVPQREVGGRAAGDRQLSVMRR